MSKETWSFTLPTSVMEETMRDIHDYLVKGVISSFSINSDRSKKKFELKIEMEKDLYKFVSFVTELEELRPLSDSSSRLEIPSDVLLEGVVDFAKWDESEGKLVMRMSSTSSLLSDLKTGLIPYLSFMQNCPSIKLLERQDRLFSLTYLKNETMLLTTKDVKYSPNRTDGEDLTVKGINKEGTMALLVMMALHLIIVRNKRVVCPPAISDLIEEVTSIYSADTLSIDKRELDVHDAFSRAMDLDKFMPTSVSIERANSNFKATIYSKSSENYVLEYVSETPGTAYEIRFKVESALTLIIRESIMEALLFNTLTKEQKEGYKNYEVCLL